VSGLRDCKAILFDVDGTIFSSEEIIHEIYIEEFEKTRALLGRPAHIPTRPEIIEQIGKPVPVIFANLAPDLSRPEQDELSGRILEGLVTGIAAGRGHHYPGVTETVRELKKRGYDLFTASNGRAPYVRSILQAGGIFPKFKSIPTVGGTIQNKSELVASILKENLLMPAQAALIGDRASDRDAAIENQVPFVAACFGHGTEEEWGGSVARIDSIHELLDLFPSRN